MSSWDLVLALLLELAEAAGIANPKDHLRHACKRARSNNNDTMMHDLPTALVKWPQKATPADRATREFWSAGLIGITVGSHVKKTRFKKPRGWSP